MRLSILSIVAAVVPLAGPVLAAQPGGVAEASINLSSFRITPATIHLAANVPVKLTLVNDANAGHDFTAPDFFAKSNSLSGAVAGGKLDLPPHGSTSVTVVPMKGSYRAWCTHFGHKLMGMTATIIVE